MHTTINAQVEKYFWGDDLDDLSWEKHSKYITETLLDKGDVDSISWLFKQISPKQLLKILPSLKLSSKAKNFWGIYLS